MITEIEVVPYTYILHMIIIGRLPKPTDNFISIRDVVGDKRLLPSILEDEDTVPQERKLCMRFSDVTYKLNFTTIPFNSEDAIKVRKFIDDVHKRPDPERLFINCEAGISRSQAIGLWAAEYLGTLDLPSYLKKYSYMQPNSLVMAELNKLLWEERFGPL